MDLPKQLLSLYLSLSEQGIPVSLNIWTVKGREGEHFFRLSNSNSGNHSSPPRQTSKTPVKDTPKCKSKDLPLSPHLPHSDNLPETDRPLKPPVTTPPPYSIPPPPINPKNETAVTLQPNPDTNITYQAQVTTKNRYSVLQESTTSETTINHSTSCSKPLRLGQRSQSFRCCCDGEECEEEEMLTIFKNRIYTCIDCDLDFCEKCVHNIMKIT